MTARLTQSLLVLLVMSFVIYALIGLMPGDPVDVMIAATPGLTPEDAARLRAYWGADQPLLVRYGRWLGALLSGDLGHSRLFAQPVVEVIGPRLLNTVLLMAGALLLALAVGLPLGILAALRPGSWLDRLAGLSSFAAISMPVFWLGLMLIVVFAVSLRWLPAGGALPVGGSGGVGERLTHLVLPVVTLAVPASGQYLRYMRAAMIEALRQDWVRTARAKGAGRARVVLRHALRGALVPVVTILALDLGALFSGTLVTETLFAYPGMGKLIYEAVMGNDFNLALAALLLATAMVLAGTLLADLAYGWLDPRTRA